MTDDEIIAVVQAHKDGKQIQRCGKAPHYMVHKWNEWKDSNPNWNFADFDYRTAPEPHLLTGYCYARDIHKAPLVGMVKVKQVHQDESENPISEPRKPREWWAEIPLDGSVGQVFQFYSKMTKGGELVRVR